MPRKRLLSDAHVQNRSHFYRANVSNKAVWYEQCVLCAFTLKHTFIYVCMYKWSLVGSFSEHARPGYLDCFACQFLCEAIIRCVFMYFHTHASTHVQTRTTHTHTHTHTHILPRTCKRPCTNSKYMYMYIYIYIHTHTHTYKTRQNCLQDRIVSTRQNCLAPFFTSHRQLCSPQATNGLQLLLR